LKSAVTPDVTRWCLNSFHAKRGVDLEGLKGQGIPASILSAALLLLDVAVILLWGSKGEVVYMNDVVKDIIGRQGPYSKTYRDYAEWNAHWEPNGRKLRWDEYPGVKVLQGSPYASAKLYFERDGGWVPVEVHTSAIRKGDAVVGAIIIAWKADT
jgi:hypothetical protein